MRRFLVAYKLYANLTIVRGRWAWAPNYDRARALVRRQLDAEGVKAFVVTYPIGLSTSEIDGPAAVFHQAV